MDKLQILIVEDEVIVSMGLRQMLESFGNNVSAEFRTGEEAVDEASYMHPDLVLMGIGLGAEMDGIDAAAKIHGQFNVPVVYLTGYADKARSKRAKLTEPYDYLFKPVESGQLWVAVEAAIYKHQNEGTPW